MILRAAGRTDVGQQRSENEDRYALAPEEGAYLVADGMGGHRAGRLASGLGVEAALRALRARRGRSDPPAEALRHAVMRANRAIWAKARARPEHAGMGTTLVALLGDGERAALAHVGDSRAYRVRRGRIRQLTDDHSLVAELLRRREISAAAAREHPHRHVLTRALGVRPEVEPDLAELSMAPEDVFVLCSDGLTAHVEDSEIAKVVREEDDPQETCERLVDLANERGGEDNVTVLVAYCEA